MRTRDDLRARTARADAVDARRRSAARPSPTVRWWLRHAGPVLGMTAMLVGWAYLPLWEWSFIDDGQLLAALDSSRARHGPVAGVAHTFAAAVRFDLDWGLFRPGYWVYVSTFYLLPSGAAHAVRLAMCWIAFAGPLVAVAHRVSAGRRPAVLALALSMMIANVSVYSGLWYPSLQELSGLALVGAGLGTRRPALRTCCWLLAAWFKAPFAWLLVVLGVVDLCRGRRGSGAARTALGVGTLAVATYFAHAGAYTDAVSFSVDRIAGNLLRSANCFGPTLLVLLVGVVGLGLRPRANGDWLPLVLLLGGLGYYANVLPWRTDQHYAAPYVHLVGLGVLLMLRDVERPQWRRAAVSVTAAALTAALFAGAAVRDGARVVATTAQLRDCVRSLPAGSVVGYNRPEAWLRLEQIVARRDPAWRGRLAFVAPGRVVGWRDGRNLTLAFYIHDIARGDSAPVLTAAPVVCRTPLATVHKVSA